MRRAGPADAANWNAFVRGRQGSSLGAFYLRWEWLQLAAKELGHTTHEFVAENDGSVVGVLPLVRVRSRLFGDSLVSMPFLTMGGLAAEGEGVVQSLVAAACAEAESLGCDYLELRCDRPLEGLRSGSHKVSMMVDLPDDPDVLWSSFSSKHRKNVKRAYRQTFRVRWGGEELVAPFYRVMERGWRALGTPLYSKEYFTAVARAFGEDVRIVLLELEGTGVASALVGRSGSTLEGIWAATDPAFDHLQVNYALYWEMMERACQEGFERFHLGRSTVDSGAARFKSRWGAEPRPLYWNHHLVRAKVPPALNPDNPRYDLAIRTWRRLPLPVLRRMGPRVARLIP